VFADAHGHTIHLGERECSAQRRYQKVIEEAPSPFLTEERRAAMGAAAVAAARAIDYVGAGTVEFLLDQDQNYYFLEMNTRIQVEHPVTEAVTGIDLVQLQFQVAQGLPLGIAQEDVQLTGHAIEARLYAEDVAGGFLPSTGRIELWQRPSGPGIRCDDGIETGTMVSPYYDSMLAKIIASGPTREVARTRLIKALKSTAIVGPHSNRDFLIATLEIGTFIDGGATTAFIAEEFPQSQWQPPELGDEELAIAGVLLYLHRRDHAVRQSIGVAGELLNWSSNGVNYTCFKLSGRDVVVRALGAQTYEVKLDDQSTLQLDRVGRDGLMADLILGGVHRSVTHWCSDANHIYVSHNGRGFTLEDQLAGQDAGGSSAGGDVPAPMHGLILEVFVETAQRVEKGARLAVLEAMKMQHDIVAPEAGEVAQILCQKGKQVASGDLLFELTLAGDEEATT